jgi:hypothetical protein
MRMHHSQGHRRIAVGLCLDEGNLFLAPIDRNRSLHGQTGGGNHVQALLCGQRVGKALEPGAARQANHGQGRDNAYR